MSTRLQSLAFTSSTSLEPSLAPYNSKINVVVGPLTSRRNSQPEITIPLAATSTWRSLHIDRTALCYT